MYQVDCCNLSGSCQDKSIKGKKLGLQICPRPGALHSRSFPGEEERAERNVGDSRDADSSGDTGAVTLLHSTHFAESG